MSKSFIIKLNQIDEQYSFRQLVKHPLVICTIQIIKNSALGDGMN